jgi:glycine betaine/proline transport system ATP-binding protein
VAKIEISGVTKVFGPRPESVLPLLGQGMGKAEVLEKTRHTVALHDISLDVEEGETFVVMGLSGSGKSTSLRLLNRLVEPTAGSVKVDGRDVLAMGSAELTHFRRHAASMVFQGFALLPHRTVLANVAYGLEAQGMERQARQGEARTWIEAVGLDGYEGSLPAELSGGMRQRVGLARALATGASILLMDEPFGALDPLIRRDMRDQLAALQKKLAKTIVFITHDLEEALRLGDRVAILNDGKVVQVGTPTDIVLRPANGFVGDFVRGVNRARVLTAAAVAVEAGAVIPVDVSPEVALDLMDRDGGSCAYAVDESGRFAGVVTREDAARLRQVPTLKPDALLEDLLAVVAGAEWPVPVVNDAGALVGTISGTDVLATLAGTKT